MNGRDGDIDEDFEERLQGFQCFCLRCGVTDGLTLSCIDGLAYKYQI